jgi:hypothetical protein
LLETGGIYIAFILSHVTTSQPTTFGVYPGYIIITTFMPFSNFKHFCIRSVVKSILTMAITLRFNSTDSRDKNVCTLDHPKTTDVWSNIRFTTTKHWGCLARKIKQLLFEIPSFHISKVFKDLKSTFFTAVQVSYSVGLTTTYLRESNLKQPRLFRVYFGKFRAVWFAVCKYGVRNTVDKKPPWYLAIYPRNRHLITDYASKLGPCNCSQA